MDGRAVPELLRRVIAGGRATFSRSRFDDFFGDVLFADFLLETALPHLVADFFATRSVVSPQSETPAASGLNRLLL
jgi:hypothetical protein